MTKHPTQAMRRWLVVTSVIVFMSIGGCSGESASTPPPPGSGDTTAPIVSNISVANITTTSATVSWTTDEASTTQVQYGLTTDYGSIATGSSSVTSHSVTLASLSPNTTYHYRVTSADAANNSATSANASFTTNVITRPPPGTSSINLLWDGPSTDSDGATALADLAGYRVYRATQTNGVCGSSSLVLQIANTTPGGTVRATIDNLTVGTHCFTVTAFDVSGNESIASNQFVVAIN